MRRAKSAETATPPRTGLDDGPPDSLLVGPRSRAAGRPMPEVVSTCAERLEYLAVEDLIPTPDNQRRIRDDDPTLLELAESIRSKGLLQPVICRPHPTLPGKYDLRAGHRRLRAHRLISAPRILAIVREMTDLQAMEATVLENLQRQDLTALEEGRGVAALLAAGRSAVEVGEQIGKSARWVHSRAQLADLEEPWVSWFETGTMSCPDQLRGDQELALTVRHLELLTRFPREVQSRLAAECEREPWRLTEGRFREFASWIGGLTGRLTLAPWNLQEPDRDGLSCAECPKRARRRQQWLFVPEGEAPAADPDQADVCLDLECWARREEAFLDERRVELFKEYPQLLLVCTEYPFNASPARRNDLNRLPVAQKGEWAECRLVKERSKGALPALVVYGEGLGTLVWVTFRSEDGQGKAAAGPKTLAEKREQLRLRRRAKAVELFAEWLRGEDAFREFDEFTTHEVLETLIAFGMNHRSDFRQPDGWLKRTESLESELAVRLQRQRRELWEFLVPVLLGRLRVFGLSDVDSAASWSAHNEMAAMARMLGKVPETFDRAAEEAIPEPKAWAKDGES